MSLGKKLGNAGFWSGTRIIKRDDGIIVISASKLLRL
jgi:hypothetical protein